MPAQGKRWFAGRRGWIGARASGPADRRAAGDRTGLEGGLTRRTEAARGRRLGGAEPAIGRNRWRSLGCGQRVRVHQEVVPPRSGRRVDDWAPLRVATAWGLYVLLRRVHENLALLFLLLNPVRHPVREHVPSVMGDAQGDGASHMQAYSAAQLDGLALLSANVYKTGSSRPSCSSARGCSRLATSSTSPGCFPASWACSCCSTESPS